MKGRSHLVIGAVAGAGGLWAAHTFFGVTITPVIAVTTVAVACAGALAPDIDHRDSTISRKVPGALLGRGIQVLAIPAALALAIFYLGGTALASGILKWLEPVVRLGLVLVVPALVLRVASGIASLVFGHRGATHSLAFGAGAAGLVALACARFGVPVWYAYVFGGGWLTHLLADGLSRRGLRSLWWPFSGR